MRPGRLLGRLITLAVATAGCLVLALLAPLFLSRSGSDEPFVGASVMASPRDMLVIGQSAQLSLAPNLSLARGVLYADGNAAQGLPISRFVLDGPQFVLMASEAGASRTTADLPQLLEQLVGLGFESLTVRRGSLAIVTGDGTTETLSDLEADISGRRKGQVTAKGSFSYRGQAVKFETTVGQNPDKKGLATRWAVKAALKNAFLQANFDGTLDVARDLQLAGQADVTMPSLRRIARWFSVPLPNAEGLNATSIKGQFAWMRRSLSFEQAKVVVDGNEGSGSLTLNLAAERPLIDGTLAFSAINLQPYYEGLQPQSFGFERPSLAWSTLDLSFPLVRFVDTDLRISAPKVTYKGFEVGRTAATLTVRSGKLLADIAEVELGSGSASLQITADTNELVPRFAIKGRIDNIDAGQAAAAFLSELAWSGRGLILLDLYGTGQSPGEIVSTLSGRASIQFGAGARLPFDVKGLRSLLKAGDVVGWRGIARGQTQFEQLEIRATLANGIAVFDTVQARAGGTAAALSGHVNLPAGDMDIRLANRADAPDRPAKASDFLGADTVRLKGDISHPTLMRDDLESADPGPFVVSPGQTQPQQ